MNNWIGTVVSLLVIALVGFIIWRRVRARNRPVKGGGYGLLLPMAIALVGFSLTLSQLMRIPGQGFHWPALWEQAAAALLGIVFGTVMLMQTAYEMRGDGMIYPKPNKNLKYILIAIVAIRLGLMQYFGKMDSTELSVLAMDMALVYLGIWRIGSFVKYRQLRAGWRKPAL